MARNLTGKELVGFAALILALASVAVLFFGNVSHAGFLAGLVLLPGLPTLAALLGAGSLLMRPRGPTTPAWASSWVALAIGGLLAGVSTQWL